MTTKDFLKLLCISLGYHNNLRVDSWRTSDGYVMWEISGEDDSGFEIAPSPGTLTDVLQYIVIDAAENGEIKRKYPNKKYEEIFGEEGIEVEIDERTGINGLAYYFHNVPQKDLLNDELRQKLKRHEELRLKQIEEECKLLKPIYDSMPVHPCKMECPDRTPVISPYTGDIIDDCVNYQCDKHFRRICKKPIKYNEDIINAIRKFKETSKEWKELQEKYKNIK